MPARGATFTNAGSKLCPMQPTAHVEGIDLEGFCDGDIAIRTSSIQGTMSPKFVVRMWGRAGVLLIPMSGKWYSLYRMSKGSSEMQQPANHIILLHWQPMSGGQRGE